MPSRAGPRVPEYQRSSDDYLHFVVQAPFVKGDKVDLVD
jgi:hypothetical protein